jgi:small conductance mechanosensitive channel
MQLWEKYGPSVLVFGRKLIAAALIIIAGRLVIGFLKRLADRPAKGKFRLHADETLASVLRGVIQYGIVLICLIMILDTFGVSTASLIALLGAAGVAIGFALRDTLSNIASGIVILFLRPFNTGDFIECGSVTGIVRDMGLFATNMETGDGIFISVPNSCLWGVPLKNFSRSSRRRVDITVTISYSDSIDTAFQVFRDIVAQEKRFLDEPAPQIVVSSLGDNGASVTLRAWAASAVFGSVLNDQTKNVKEKFDEAGLSIAVPKREIHLVRDEVRREA